MPIGLAGGVENFVDRVEHLAELRELLDDVTAGGGGRALVIDGVTGMGKSTLLRRFVSETEQVRPPGACRVVLVRCQPVIGSGLSYGLAIDLLQSLGKVRSPHPGGLFRKAGIIAARGAVAAAPEALSALVPGLGAVFTLGAEVTKASLAAGSIPADSLQPFQHAAAERIVDAVLDAVRSGPPVVLLVDDVQDCDLSSLLVLERLLRRLSDRPLAVVLSHCSDGVRSSSAGSPVEPLIRAWAREGLVRRRTMGGLPRDAVDDLVRLVRDDATPDLGAELHELTSGHAVFLSLCLAEWDPARRGIVLPEDLRHLADDRLDRLRDDERDLVLIAAAQGEAFLSRHVADVKGVPHDDVADTLARVARAGTLIRPADDEPPGWVDADDLRGADCYRFEHRALWQMVYEQLSPHQRRSRHAGFARALTYRPLREMPLPRRLEIARHLRLAGPDFAAETAQAHYDLAVDAATGGQVGEVALSGLSLSEAEQHCLEAITAIRRLPAGDESRDRRLIEAAELLLSLTEVRWRGRHLDAAGLDIDALAAEAESAAARCGDASLRIRTTLLRGKTLLATSGLTPSLEKLGEAVLMAEEHGDPVALFVARVEYGRQLSKRRLADGHAQLREAEAIYENARLAEHDGPLVRHARNLGEMQLGISLYDTGDLGEALARLRRCVERLHDEPLQAELPIALNYYAQVLASLGSYQEAEAVLREAVAIETARGGESGWRAYNKAMLARLLAENGTAQEALELVADAWAETERTWLANLVPIVRNLYAETLLLAAAGSDELLLQADRLAVATIAETLQSGMVRSEIAAHSLRGRIHAERGDVAGAGEHARTAVRLLTEVGDMPALWTEEVLYYAAVALAADGEDDEAEHLLARARREVARKAATILDDALRTQFLTDVVLNAAIGGAGGGTR
ncbi:AAA family ATPase [Antribacter sp. KLBMP9083]|uniref:AAA family ATPase n=1 Tax=Antribacter soli TaxID=2910976 RepID=A0AA41QFM2_9MICO|nr:AAA family ATPase [Antribacter soli]MCF4121287.1 AAA family ATPase [Antribacter soli]